MLVSFDKTMCAFQFQSICDLCNLAWFGLYLSLSSNQIHIFYLLMITFVLIGVITCLIIPKDMRSQRLDDHENVNFCGVKI